MADETTEVVTYYVTASGVPRQEIRTIDRGAEMIASPMPHDATEITRKEHDSLLAARSKKRTKVLDDANKATAAEFEARQKAIEALGAMGLAPEHVKALGG